MSKKGGDFFEEHIEEIVLAVVGLVCIWLLIFRVFISPNRVEYEGEKFSPGKIDDYISEQAAVLEDKLNRKPEPPRAYEPRVDDFVAYLNSAIRNVDTTVYPPTPPLSTEVPIERAYDIPSVGEVKDVSVGHIRAVAYVPTEAINEDTVYEQAGHEPNDIDFVTVEAKLDVAGLYERFYGSFAGDNVPEEWCDPCLAEPVFAAVQLQRQEQLGDGSWSDWQVVPRTRIDHRREMFEIIEDVKELPAGGIKVCLLQFDERGVKMDLLQPRAYRIASAKEEWFPPSLHKKFLEQQREEKMGERREARVAGKEGRERERVRSERRGRASRTRRRSVEGVYDEAAMEEPFGMPADRTSTRRSRSERRSDRERPERRSREISKTMSISNIYDEFDKILITEKTDLAKMREPLAFWAHDDNVELEKSYRYKVRLGVFNPIAGTNQFSEQYKRLKNKAILWSEFSDVTEPVEIPGTLCFFPREIQEAAKTVMVQVCRYVLGYWYSEDFAVKQGEVIGKVKTVKLEAEEEQKDITVPRTIDYATGAVLVDVIAVNDWSG